MRTLLATLAAMVCLGGSVAAQTPAESLIAEQNVGDVFEALPNPNARLVRHRQSGMLCLFHNSTEAQLQVFRSLPRGDDVACIQREANGAEMAMFASRLPEVTADDAMRSAVRSMVTWAWTSQPRSITREHRPDAAFPYAEMSVVGELRGQQTFVRLSTAAIPGGWIIKQRFVAPLGLGGPDTEGADIARALQGADIVFTETLRVISEQQ
jgi:hypothetical protein